MNIVFGTDGWRGLLDSEINEESVAAAAQAFADYLNERSETPRAAVGYDGRRNSKKFAEIFSEVLSGNNIKVYLSDKIVQTPVLSYYVKAKGLNAGAMITASHNPAEYNGIKFKADYGGPFLTEETHKVEAFLGKSEIKRGGPVETADMLPVYLENIKRLVDFEKIKKAGLKILADSMGGAGQRLIEEIFRTHGITCETIYGEAKEDFAGRSAEPIEKNLAPLADKLKEEGIYSFGIATDGDADRLGVLLDTGEWLSAQETILLLSDFIVNEKKTTGDIVKTSSVTDKLKVNFEKDGRKVHDVQVGFKYICETMLNEDAAFGAEESGGYGYKGHIPERDGILSAFFLTEALACSGYNKLSELIKEKRKTFGEIYYDRIDHKYEDEDRVDRLPAIYESSPSEAAGKKIKRTDKFFSSRGIINGLKFVLEGDTRWLLMRASETEPLVRIYAEGQNNEEVKDFLNAGIELLKNR